MLNRRQFLFEAPAAAALIERAWGQAPQLKIGHVDIIHHTHTDVGYTALPSVVRDLQKRYLDVAIDACESDSAFRWTVESLLELDDWWRASSPARRNALAGLVEAGRIDVMAMPFNQTPFLNQLQWRQMMSWIPAALWRSLKIRVAMQNDVNGVPRAGALALLDHGVHYLAMGSNDDSGGPPFERPRAFWWKMPDGRRLFVWLGEQYGSAMRYLQAARNEVRFRTDEDSIRKAHQDLVRRLQAIESQGYSHDRLILSFTNPRHYDNGSPYSTLAPFVVAWNQLGLRPTLRLATTTEAVLDMEKAVGGHVSTEEGEWTDWWANGDASAPREVAASRLAKRNVAAAMSPVFGAMPQGSGAVVETILKDLCLFDEHTWGASASISAPYSLQTLGQFVEKSDLAYRPMGMAEALLSRRVRARIYDLIFDLPQGIYAVNATASEIGGWANLDLPGSQFRSLVDVKTNGRTGIRRGAGPARFWLENLAPHSMRVFRADTVEAADSGVNQTPQVKLDASGWPLSISWPGMAKPLFDGAPGDFLCVGVVPPADRRTITQLHANKDPQRREAIRKVSFRETVASYGTAAFEETPHTVIYTQEIRHQRIAQGRRSLEAWKGEPRARISIRFDRISSLAPEVFFLAFTLPEGCPLPLLSSGGVPFTPYRDQLGACCRDYFAIDGWAHYPTADGHWLWVTRDAALVAIGSPHVVERHQKEPADHRRILAMVFDNCWHTNFVADSHGTMEFQFELIWRHSIEKPADLAASLSAEPIVLINPAVHETTPELNNLYRR